MPDRAKWSAMRTRGTANPGCGRRARPRKVILPGMLLWPVFCIPATSATGTAARRSGAGDVASRAARNQPLSRRRSTSQMFRPDRPHFACD